MEQSGLEFPQSGFFRALQTQNPKDLEAWIQSGGNPQEADEEGNTPLHRVCEKGADALILPLIQYQALLDARNAAGKTPLELAAQNGFYEPVKILIGQGASFSPNLT